MKKQDLVVSRANQEMISMPPPAETHKNIYPGLQDMSTKHFIV